MANTVIVLKHSTDTGTTPSVLANGELAINTYDGKLFYRGGSGNTIQTIEKYDGPGGTDGDVQFNDSGTLNGDSGLTYNKTTDILTVVGGVITGGVNVAPTISSAYNHANAAFDAANTAGGADTYARNTANASFIHANAAFDAANTNATTITVLQGVNTTQNTSISNLEAVETTQNTNITTTNNTAVAAFNAANTAQNTGDAAFLVANNNTGINATQNTSIDTLNSVNFIAIPSSEINANVSSFGGNNAVWNEQTVDLSSYAGGTLRVVWQYTTSTSFYGDIQLDDVYIGGTTYDFESNATGWETSIAYETDYDSVSWSSVATSTTAGRWNRDLGGTPSGTTGLAEDHTLGTTSGYYLYAETSSSAYPYKNIWLRSPEITLNANPGYLSFWEARYGSTMGNVTVYLIGTNPPAESAKANIAWNHANAAFDAANTAGGATLGDVLALSIALG